jgi:hypothetical protein
VRQLPRGNGLADLTAESRATKAVDSWAEAYDINQNTYWRLGSTNTEDIWDTMSRVKEKLCTTSGYGSNARCLEVLI